MVTKAEGTLVEYMKSQSSKLLEEAAVREARRVQVKVPLPNREAQHLAAVIVKASGLGLIVNVTKVFERIGGRIGIELVIVSPQKFTPKFTQNMAKEYFQNLMKSTGWRPLSGNRLQFETRAAIRGMETLAVASSDFLSLYGLTKNQLKFSVELYLFGAIEKLSSVSTESSDFNSTNDAAADDHRSHQVSEAKVKRFFAILKKSQPDAAKKESSIDLEAVGLKIDEYFQALYLAKEKYEDNVDEVGIAADIIVEYDEAIRLAKEALLKDVQDKKLSPRRAILSARGLASVLISPDGFTITGQYNTAIFNAIDKTGSNLQMVLDNARQEIADKLPKNARPETIQRRYQKALQKYMPKVFDKTIDGFGNVNATAVKFAKYAGAAAKHIARVGLVLDAIKIVSSDNVKEFIANTLEVGLSAAGGIAGAKAGAALGAAVGGVVGAIIGGIVFGIAGSFLGEKFALHIMAFTEDVIAQITKITEDAGIFIFHRDPENGFTTPFERAVKGASGIRGSQY